ncbi:ATP-binding protein [Kitasatospora sp. NPDC056138]|uniref:ATP-binding protein n=1 Tax=Kitasatospora sp. NPDC056138 TaxID=3345724 RepID=UPI0035D8F4E5
MAQPTGEFRQDGLRPRTGEVVSGGLLLTVGTPDGSEARPCPDEWRPVPRRSGGAGGGGPQGRGAPGPGAPVGPLALGRAPADLPLLEREPEIAELLELLSEGRSVRLVGRPGSGRSALLAAVAEAAAGIAPDGVVRLAGYRRTAQDLLQDLFAATHRNPGFRPDRRQLPALLAPVGAIVVIDDVEPSGAELEELLATAPDCAFLIAVAADSPAPAPGSRLEDRPVAGLSRPACLGLVARLTGRPLEEPERSWVVDLWFESQGLPLRFVQAAALLRQRDAEVDALVAARQDRHSVFGLVKEVPEPEDPAELESELRSTVPLPSVAESASPAVRLAEGLSESGQAVLRLAVAFGGELPTAPHLPALIDVGLGESALRELSDCGLAVSIGGHHRLSSGVLELLAPHWEPGTVADGAAQHFSWWVGHGSVDLGQVAAEAEVVISALLADRAADRPQAVLWLARAAAPAFALSLRWGAWERALQLGREAATSLGSTADEAWFRQELGVLALCEGAPGRARAELEAAVALRAAVGESRGGAAARRMLDLLQAETVQLPAAQDTPGAGVRRPSIRAIAAQVPRRFGSTRVPERTRRAVLAVGTAVLALSVLGTAVGLSLAGSHQSRTRTVQPGGSLEENSLTENLPTAGSTTGSASRPPSVGAPASTGAPAADAPGGADSPTSDGGADGGTGRSSSRPTTGWDWHGSPVPDPPSGETRAPSPSHSRTGGGTPSPTGRPTGEPSSPESSASVPPPVTESPSPKPSTDPPSKPPTPSTPSTPSTPPTAQTGSATSGGTP